MASDHQVALTRSQRMPTPSTQISRAARQVVPAFLQKLYEMVNDPNNAELIRWSDAGDSFFVLDHERFAHEVLGRWFKHRNFSSFVRQLNMYGFHKIPHLQQGVLKSDTDTEFWNFAHANFHRGQPDLLCLIQRKKQVPQPGEEGALDIRDTNATSGTQQSGSSGQQSSPTIASGQILDVNSIVNGIAAIKRHQTTISAELNELKRSNQLLWQDALAARAKHQKQQDTINRILKFLAGVFGQHAASTGPVTTSAPGTPTGNDNEATGMKRRMRLMIEDAKRDGPMKTVIRELPMEMDDDYNNYPSIGTPNSITSVASPSPSVTLSEGTPAADPPTFYNSNLSSTTNSTSTNASNSRNSSATVNADDPHSPQISRGVPQQQQPQQPQPQPQQQQQQQQQGKQLSRAVTPARHSSQSFEFDPRLQGVLNQLSPAQIQHLLASLASQPLNDNSASSSSSSGTINPSATTTGGLLTQYHQPSSFDFSINPASQSSVFSTSGIPIQSHNGLIPFDNYDAGSPHEHQAGHLGLDVVDPEQQQHQARMERHWQAAEDIDKDVNALNTSISSLIQTFGLDPSLLDENLPQTGPPSSIEAGGSISHNDDMQGHDGQEGNVSTSDFDFFDSFFNSMPASGSGSGLHGNDGIGGGTAAADMDYNDLASTAFLDEASTPTPSDMASPVQSLSSGLNMSPAVSTINAPAENGSTTPGSRLKRKSEVILDFDSINAIPCLPGWFVHQTEDTGYASLLVSGISSYVVAHTIALIAHRLRQPFFSTISSNDVLGLPIHYPIPVSTPSLTAFPADRLPRPQIKADQQLYDSHSRYGTPSCVLHTTIYNTTHICTKLSPLHSRHAHQNHLSLACSSPIHLLICVLLVILRVPNLAVSTSDDSSALCTVVQKTSAKRPDGQLY